jgi:hypothetical protein
MAAPSFTLSILPGVYAICRLEPNSPLPDWASGSFFSITRTAEELSVVCPQVNVPERVKHEGGWRCMKVEGPLELSLIGILASLTTALAQANINVFAISTFDTDYLLVKEERLEEAVRALGETGHNVMREG